jgi:hypothetical protein
MLALPEELPDDDVVSELLPCIRAMVKNLPEHDRQALVLTEYQGLTQKELSERLGLSFSGAKSRVQRAREKLKQQLLECCHFELDRRGHVIDYQPRCACCATGTCCAEKQPIQVQRRPASFVAVPVYRSRSKSGEETKLLYRRSRRERNHAMSTAPTNDEQLRAEVRDRSARTALQVLGTEQPQTESCCGPTCCTSGSAENTETQAVVQVSELETAHPAACCASSCCSGSDASPVTEDL